MTKAEEIIATARNLGMMRKTGRHLVDGEITSESVRYQRGWIRFYENRLIRQASDFCDPKEV